MSDLKDLYQELIVGHAKRPHNFRVLEAVSAPLKLQQAAGHNPLCGDKLHLSLVIDAERIKEAAFQGSGCAISTASASLMTDAIKGKTTVEVKQLFEQFIGLVTGATPTIDLGKLSAFAGVREFPARVKCASLAWHTLEAALEQKTAAVTTESS